MRVRTETDQRAERREQQRQRHHQRDQPGRNPELDDHHAVERAVEQHHRHADRDLEQRQPQQPAERQFRASRRRRTAGSAGRARIQSASNGRRRVLIGTSAPAPARCRSRDRIRCVRATRQWPSPGSGAIKLRRSCVGATGSMAGARSPRGKDAADGVHHGQRGVRGAKVNSIEPSVRAPRPASTRDDVGAA